MSQLMGGSGTQQVVTGGITVPGKQQVFNQRTFSSENASPYLRLFTAMVLASHGRYVIYDG